jgi:hypothetical protein
MIAAEVTPSRKRPRGYITDYTPQAKTRALLASVVAVLTEYRDYWPLAVRQVFYRLNGAHGYPKTETFYKSLCHHVANARRGGALSFDAIRDDGVVTIPMHHYATADDFLHEQRRRVQGYRRDLMADQPMHIEVWCEAAGMIGQLARVAHRYSVNVYSSSGFDSLTAKKAISDRICAVGKPAVILHLGDFDPSGASIFESAAEDVAAFVAADRPHGLVSAKFKRVALTADQVRRYGLPTAPAKVTDSRSKAWAGETCQLEALSPSQIADILDGAILQLLDTDRLVDAEIAGEREREDLTRMLLTFEGGAA